MQRQGPGEEAVDALKTVLSVVKCIVNNPDDVEVSIEQHRYRLVAELFTHVDDVGQVVGRNGHIISSLRAFVAALSGKYGIKIDLDYITEQDKKKLAHAG